MGREVVDEDTAIGVACWTARSGYLSFNYVRVRL
jgi:hypothetical protein